jgi:hypothetical protein
MTRHADLAGANLHEPKGIAAASASTVYVANGSGSGTWQKIASGQIASTIFNINKGTMLIPFADLSAASFVLVPFPFACTVNTVTIVINGTVGAGTNVLTFTNSTGPAVLGTLDIGDASTPIANSEGDLFTFTATVNHTFTANTYLKIASDGGAATAAAATMVIAYTRTS